MATQAEIVLEDDYNYIAVTAPGRAIEDGTVCVLEIGATDASPDDEDGQLFMLGADGVRELIARLQGFLDAAEVLPKWAAKPSRGGPQ